MSQSQGRMPLDTACPWSDSVLDVAIQVKSTTSFLHSAFRRRKHTYVDSSKAGVVETHSLAADLPVPRSPEASVSGSLLDGWGTSWFRRQVCQSLSILESSDERRRRWRRISGLH